MRPHRRAVARRDRQEGKKARDKMTRRQGDRVNWIIAHRSSLIAQLTAPAHPAILCASQSARGAAVYPQIYLGDIPSTSDQRRALRALALDLRARIHATRATEPTTLLLHFRAAEGAVPL